MYLLPRPKSFEEKAGTFLLQHGCPIVIDSQLSSELYTAAQTLQAEICEITGFTLPILRLHKEETAGCIYLTSLEGDNPEAYELQITETSVVIRGVASAGILYGVSSLRQVLRQAGALLPCMMIQDYPSLPARGYYFDTSRGRVPTLDSLKKLVDILSLYKLNQLQLYIEHSYLFQDLSEMWRDDTPLTAEDILTLDRYCQERNIELIPSLASFGHLYKLLCTKSYQHLCELEGSNADAFSFDGRMAHHTVDVSNPESQKLVKKMLTEYMQLFTSRHFNLCADETFDLGKGRSKALAEKKGLTSLYTDFVSMLADFLLENGRTPMFWSDIICEDAQAITTLPKELICLHWDYAPDVSEDRLKRLVDAGAKQLYVCPGVHGWNHLMNNQHNAYENISRLAVMGHQYQAMGMLTTDWGDFGHINHPDFSLPGLVYGAAFSWDTVILPEDEINRQISAIQYQDDSQTLVDTFRSLGQQEAFPWYFVVRIMETLSIQKDSARAAEFLKDCAPDRWKEDNTRIDALERALYAALRTAKPEAAAVINAYITAADGQKLLNRLLPVIEQKLKGADLQDPTLAGELETWLVSFKKLWLTVSRESEFYRIAHIFNQYADYLRV